MVNFLKKLDVYPKTYDEFKERTFSGAAISVVSVVCIVILIISEINWYSKIDRVDELYVDTNTTGKLPIFINITFPNVACDIISLDTMDGFGESQIDVDHSVTKVRMDRDGNFLSAEKQAHLGESETEVEKVKEALTNPKAKEKDYCGGCYGAEEYPGQCCNTCDEVMEAYRKKGWGFNVHTTVEQCVREKMERQIRASAKEGCMVHGSVHVNKVQGNFHFAPGKSFQHAGNHVHDFLPFELEGFNISHKITKLGFGADYPGLVNPLDNEYRMFPTGPNGLYQYFIKVVPTIYEKLDGTQLTTNQYSVTEHFRPRSPGIDPSGGGVVPGVFFIYDLSPIMVHIKETQRHHSLLHFLTNLCAIIGGVFTVAGIIDRVWHSASSQMMKNFAGKGI
eukprot:TRINITY_DN64161_c0_g2_i1.p1 TRINITY_DN64161_c0_g2~~TRINITY_DN64161_c0_g2_i1.p1  ORF type:complete len:393 (+),score=38.73 TRINITY_DN64161_c0_g2_i1:78-1256(+)